MLIKIYSYLKNYKDEKLNITKNSALFQKYVTVYNNTLYKLIHLLYKMTYIQKLHDNVQFHEECIYY